MKKDNLFQVVLLIGLLTTIILMAAMFIMDSVVKDNQIKALESSVTYLSDKYDSLQKQSDKQQRQINQDFLILTQGWKE